MGEYFQEQLIFTCSEGSISEVYNQIDAYFVDDLGNRLVDKIYHRVGSNALELGLVDGSTIECKEDLPPVLIFENCTTEDFQQLCRNKGVTYWHHDGQKDAVGIERMIHVGTHLPIFVEKVLMQRRRLNRVELTHIDGRFNVTCNLSEVVGRRVKCVYNDRDENRFGYISAGGHDADAEENV
jgi:hypothetical protein